MKVMFIATGLHTGGAELMLYKILSRIDRGRVHCEVVNLKRGGSVQTLIESLGVPVHSLGLASPLQAIHGLLRLRRIIQERRPTVVQSWMYHANAGAAMVTRLSGPSAPPLVWGIRYTLADLSFEKPLTRWMIRRSPVLSRIPGAILYDSEAGRRDHESIGYPHEAGRVIPNGIDFDLWRIDAEARRQVRLELGIGPESFLVGMIGRFHPMKDHATFLEAAERFLTLRPDAHFVLAGSEIESRNPAIQSLLKGRDFRDRLHLLGHRNDVGRVMAALDVLSCASRAESFPNVVLEALACGVLSVVSNAGDAPRLVPDTRFVVPPAAPDALAAAWNVVAALPLDQKASLVCDFRKVAMERYSIAAVAQTYQSFYEDLALRS
jgi:glycosyltransferase involved in cell wall biosynthesis